MPRIQELGFLVLAFSLVFDIGSTNAADPPEKPGRSQFEMKAFNQFISLDLSRPKSSGSFEELGLETRTITGRALDAFGKPIVGALVALVEEVGHMRLGETGRSARTTDSTTA